MLQILKRRRKRLLAIGVTSYSLVILGAVVAAYAYKLRTEGIFACQADEYTSDGYLAYCHAREYGDYEHGGFWFGLEPEAWKFATNAEVLFLGESRMQVAFSTAATAGWFASAVARYYLLGFGYAENSVFAEEVLRKLRPHAKVYVINVDRFFERSETSPARTVMRDQGARVRYEMKHLWQRGHRVICGGLPAMCGNLYVIFRSRETGAYSMSGLSEFTSRPVSYDQIVDRDVTGNSTAIGRDFVSHLPVKRGCIILTTVPTVGTNIGTTSAIGTALGIDLMAPELEGLQTFDGSHLDRASAERWSKAFLQAAGPKIRRCLDKPQASHS